MCCLPGRPTCFGGYHEYLQQAHRQARSRRGGGCTHPSSSSWGRGRHAIPSTARWSSISTLVVYLVLTGFLTLLILVVLLSLYGFSKLIGPVYQDYESGPCCRGTPPT
jgi:hypothetical protein